MRVPSSLGNVADRVKRFIRHDNPRAIEIYENIISPLSKIGDVSIVGGLVRDLAFYGADERPISDIDFVVSGRPAAVDRFAKSLGAVPNRFGGYGVKGDGFKVDFWSISRTWAKAEKLVVLNKPADLIKSTFFDWDAVVYNITRDEISAIPGYLDRLNRRVLDINLWETPSVQGNLVRALRRLVMWDARPGRVLSRFLSLEWHNHSWSDITNAERGAFGTCYLNQFESIIDYRRKVLSSRNFRDIGLDDRRQDSFDFMNIMPVQIGWSDASYDTNRFRVLKRKI